MRPVILILLLALIGLQYKLWLGDGSLLQWIQLEEKLKMQEQDQSARYNLLDQGWNY